MRDDKNGFIDGPTDSPDRSKQAQELSKRALSLPTADRDAFLDEACGSDEDLRTVVNTIVSDADPARAGLQAQDGGSLTRTVISVDPMEDPRQIGEYRVLDQLGSGGMGVVYRAEQSGPVRREVAIKVIKLGMDTHDVVARFETERQALAVMDHPNIAQVYDAGATEAGRPYFVMELVKGVPLNNYCDQQKLSIRERLDLFIAICRAVQHAHQKGVIHRDLKHSNILVALHGGTAVPKIIDFGVAKATGMRLTDKTLFTSTGQVIGTPEFMSPEQADLSSLDIDTRTDIYALGVILYEMLVGHLPFPSDTLRGSSFLEMQRIICEETPPRPSSHFVAGSEESTRNASSRCSDVTTLRRTLHGDLDWIVMKALEKDRRRRYETANALARDIEQYIQHRPIEARPPSATYRLGKFVRRHRIRVALGTALMLAVLVGSAGTLIGFVEAQREADRSRTVLNFMKRTLLAADPEIAQGEETTILQAVDRAAADLGEALGSDPVVEAEIRATIGEIYYDLNRLSAAEPHVDRAVTLYREQSGPDARETLEAMNLQALIKMAEGEYATARTILEPLLGTMERIWGRDDPQTLTAVHNVGAAYLSERNTPAAIPFLERALAGRKRVLGQRHNKVLATANNLGQAYESLDQPEKAEPMYREALEIRRAELGSRHPKTLISVFNLGNVLMQLDRNPEAEPLIVEARDGFSAVFDETHPYTRIASRTLAGLWVTQGEFAKAEPLALRSYEQSVAAEGEQHENALAMAELLVDIYTSTDRRDQADVWKQRIP